MTRCDRCWVRNLGTSSRRGNRHAAGGEQLVAQRLPGYPHLRGMAWRVAELLEREVYRVAVRATPAGFHGGRGKKWDMNRKRAEGWRWRRQCQRGAACWVLGHADESGIYFYVDDELLNLKITWSYFYLEMHTERETSHGKAKKGTCFGV